MTVGPVEPSPATPEQRLRLAAADALRVLEEIGPTPGPDGQNWIDQGPVWRAVCDLRKALAAPGEESLPPEGSPAPALGAGGLIPQPSSRVSLRRQPRAGRHGAGSQPAEAGSVELPAQTPEQRNDGPAADSTQAAGPSRPAS